MHQEVCAMSQWLMRQRNHVQPFCVLEIGDTYAALPMPWQTPDEKYAYIRALRDKLRAMHFDYYTIVVEAWVATVNMKVSPELANVPPSERSDREDVLLVMSRHRSGETYDTKFRVEYTRGGKVKLGPAEHLEGDATAGLMANLFEDDPTYH
jgi:hypothetical protein